MSKEKDFIVPTGKSFALKYHGIKLHSENGEIECDICKEALDDFEHYLDHMKAQHTFGQKVD